MSDRGLLSDVADAVAAQQEVDWDRCAQRALPDERNAIDHLRTFAGICRAVGRAGTPAGPLVDRDGHGSRLVRRAVGVLVVVALLQSVVGLATGVTLLPAATEGMLAALAGPLVPDVRAVSPTGFLPVSEMTPAASFFRIVPHVLYPVCGLLLFVGGRFDRRAWLLGAVLVLLGAFWAQPVTRGFGVGLYPELFLPALLWMFVREFPRVRRRTRLDDAAAGFAGLAAVVGGALQVANLPPVQSLSPSLAVLAREVPGTYVAPAFFGPYCVLVLAALAVLLLRARGVVAEERTRTRLFVAGIVAALAPHVEGVIEVASPGTVSLAAANWVSVLGSVSALAVPCLTMYAAISLRVLDVRTTVRVSARRLLTRGGLALVVLGPLAALGGLLESSAYWSLGEALADPLVQVCVACAAAAVAALAFRERLLARLDVWVAPETADQRLALAMAGADFAQVPGVTEVAAVVGRAARRGAGVTGALLVVDEASGARGHQFVAADSSLAPLARTSMIAHVMEEIRLPLLVDPDARYTAFDLLPPDEAAWVAATSTAAVVRVSGPGAETAGLLAVGRPTDAGRLRPVDLAFLDALASTAGLALARLRQQDGPAGRTEPPPGRECRGCGRLAAASDAGTRCDACGGAWAAAPVPAMLAGKFLLERRIGAGGMGTVFRARDIALDRPVAVKSLDQVSSAHLARLKPEAQAMAAQAHPGIAQIHGLETWRGRPMLVMEYLDGGTLATHIGRGPMPPADAVRVGLAVAEALAALHAAGYRHGDIKPSNIGFTSNETVKLLDFGLAGPAGDSRSLTGGTVAYLSPEALGGAPVGTADDIWALGVVVYEMAAGQRPFAGGTLDELADGIRRRRLQPSSSSLRADDETDARTALLAFAGGMLTTPLSARPATAEAFAAALRSCVPGG